LRDVSLILLAAGSSSRFGTPVKKQWLRIGEVPLWQFVTERFKSFALFENIIITAAADEAAYMRSHGEYTIVEGGSSRQESLKKALQKVTTPYVIVSDIARACIDKSMLKRLLAQKEHFDVIVPFIGVSDTVVYKNETISREELKRVQTPQLSRTDKLKEALNSKEEFTDESSAISAAGGSIFFVDGSENAHKLTTIDDLSKLSCLRKPASTTLTGIGMDIHAFEEGKTMMLCGTEIDVPYGFKAHSDGDVAIHALIDALLGAAGMGDIGELYPDTDANYAGVDSTVLLQDTVKRICAFGYEIGNIDMTIMAEAPRLLPYKRAMKEKLASLLGIRVNFVNIKATTAEKLGFIGRKEGVTVHAVANLTYHVLTQSNERQESK